MPRICTDGVALGGNGGRLMRSWCGGGNLIPRLRGGEFYVFLFEFLYVLSDIVIEFVMFGLFGSQLWNVLQKL